MSFNYDKSGAVIIYIDGCCLNNGRENPSAGIGVWFGPNHPLNISAPVIGRQTNNTAEIQAAIAAINAAYKNDLQYYDGILLRTDSHFVYDFIVRINFYRNNNWCRKNGAPLANKDDFRELNEAMHKFGLDRIAWEHVYAHRGEGGNKEADKLAKRGAHKY